MSYNEETWRRYVLAYSIEVPQEDVEEELYIIRSDMKHRMIYEQMSGEEGDYCLYSFTPGWFPETPVKKLGTAKTTKSIRKHVRCRL